MIFDTECTGLGDQDLVIELAYIIYENEEPVETYSKLWRTKRRSNSSAQRVHKIPYTDVVASNNLPDEELELFQKKMETVDRVVAHNLRFDWKMLQQTAHENGIDDFCIPNGFCTLINFRKEGRCMFSSFKNTELFLNTGGKTDKKAHRALCDVEMTAHNYFWGFGKKGKFIEL